MRFHQDAVGGLSDDAVLNLLSQMKSFMLAMPDQARYLLIQVCGEIRYRAG